MYASMRRIERQLAPQLRAVSGFVAYYLVDIGNDEISSISIFQKRGAMYHGR